MKAPSDKILGCMIWYVEVGCGQGPEAGTDMVVFDLGQARGNDRQSGDYNADKEPHRRVSDRGKRAQIVMKTGAQ